MKTNLKRSMILIFSLLISFALVSCTVNENQNESSKETKQASVATEEKATDQSSEANSESKASGESESQADAKIDVDREIVLAAPRDLSPGEKDAYYCSIILEVWQPLVTLEDGAPKPCLAESWTMSDDAKEMTLKLREGVKFHDGSDFNADVVIANINRMKDHSPIRSPFYTMKLEKSYPNLDKVEKISDYEVKVVFTEPSPTAINRLINFGSPMASPNCFNEDGSFNGFVIGTGPYEITEHQADQFTKLEAFDDYWGEKAKSKNVKILSMPSPQTRFAALQSEEIDGVLDIGAILAAQANELSKDERFVVDYTPSTISHFMQFNNERISDKKLVKAINLAIDRNLITEQLYYGYAMASANPLNASEPGFVKDEVVVDLEQAKSLAKEVLGDERLKLNLLVPQYGINRYPYKEQAEYIQATLAEIGIDVEIEIVEGSEQKKRRNEGNFDLAFHTQGMPNGDPVTMLNVFMGEKNKGRFNDPKAVEMLKTTSQELDDDKRMQYYKDLQAYALEQMPTFPLYHDMSLIVCNKHLKDYKAKNYGVTLSKMYWQE